MNYTRKCRNLFLLFEDNANEINIIKASDHISVYIYANTKKAAADNNRITYLSGNNCKTYEMKYIGTT
jgi:hypothetical protein